MKSIKKLLFLSLCFAFSLCGMERPNNPQISTKSALVSSPNEFENLTSKVMPSITPLAIEKGFGEKFDFAATLKSENISNSTYKKRLIAFKRYLFNYVQGFQRPSGQKNENSGASITFLKEYLHKASAMKFFANSLPIITNCLDNNQLDLVRTYIPEHVARQLPSIRFESEFGQIALFPHLVSFGITNPGFVITEADAESIAVAISIWDEDHISGQEKINQALSFLSRSQMSKQAYLILNMFLFKACSARLDEIRKHTYTIPQLSEEDNKSFLKCRILCPHLIKLSVLEQKLLNCNREFLRKKFDNTVIFEDAEGSLFNEVHKYVSVVDRLSEEYSTIYKRINEELKRLKLSYKQNPAEAALETVADEDSAICQPEQKLIVSQPELTKPIKLKYAKRITRWFKESFVRTINDSSSILYHSLLPCVADPIIVNHGIKTTYANKTHKGQKDDHYSIAGKIINEKTKEETYCIFDICIDPKGICYHRGLKKCNWENLGPEFRKSSVVEDEQYQDDHETLDTKDNKPEIIQETKFSATLTNSKYGYKIVLFKGI